MRLAGIPVRKKNFSVNGISHAKVTTFTCNKLANHLKSFCSKVQFLG